MAPRVDHVESDAAPPPRTEVVVIGGGIAGASTALFLARKGIPTVLCEKGCIGAEQSSRNWGWCRTMGRDAQEIPLALESLRLWRQMNALAGRETGFRQTGIAYLCDTPAMLAGYDDWLEAARQFQIPTRRIGAEAVDTIVPGSAVRWAGAVHTPEDGCAEPGMAAPAIAEGARAHGAGILTGCAVRGLETQGGRVAGVVTERGRIACQSVVLAGGAWSRLFCGNLGIDLPALKVLGSVLRTEKLPGGPEVSAGSSEFGFRKRLDGGYTVARRNASVAELVPDSFRLFRDFAPAWLRNRRELRLRVGRRFIEEWRLPRRWRLDQRTPFEQVRVLDPAPIAPILEGGRQALLRAFPFFRDMVVAERWGGLIDVMPDAVPVISPVEKLPGFYLATGFSGHGFGIGPGAGRLMAELITGETPVVDPAPFRFSRFRRTA
ncbi:MAG: FAD-binding oxidoreductase [Rhodospirillales bacterium]|nr:FAD-binding oxidoreductase [Rhodospirillales bacterium]